MCGFFGVLHRGHPPERAETRARLELANVALRRRGPDDAGVWVSDDGRVGLSHTRLAILDLSSAGHQPMVDVDSGDVIAYNGEIYNFAELKRGPLAAERFRTHGDTEVLLKGLSRYGADFLPSLEGMYAFAHWNSRDRSLLLATDLAGKKPLYIYEGRDVIVFGSEIKALRASGLCEWVEDAEALREYLFYGYVPQPKTFYRGVRKLGAAQYLRVDAREGQLRTPVRYWDIPVGESYGSSYADAKAELRSLMQAAVARRLVADVPVGAFLSGGLDSSVVSLAAMRALASPLRTFSVGFDSARADLYDESPYARLVAERLGTDHREIRVRAGGLDAEPILAHFDDLYADSSAIPTFILCRETVRHVKVALSGDGGDELFGGYLRFRAGLLSERWRSPLRALLAPFQFGSEHPRSKLGYLKRFRSALHLPLNERLARWNSFFTEDELVGFESAALEKLFEPMNRYEEELRGADLGTRILYLNFKTYLFDDLLPKVDRMSMFHGLEVRSPFLDKKLIEFAFRLPTAWKFDAFSTKKILKDAYRADLGADIVDRKKHGFAFPLEEFVSDAGPFDRVNARLDRSLPRPNADGASRRFALWSAEALLKSTPVATAKNLSVGCPSELRT